MSSTWRAAVAVVVVGGTIVAARPAMATEREAEPAPPMLDTRRAAGGEPDLFISRRMSAGTLSALGPVAMLGTAAVLGGLGFPSAVAGAAVLGAPLALGAGHLYAGEPWRGAAVGLGGLAIAGGGLLLGVGAMNNYQGSGPGFATGMVAWGVVAAGYYVWAVADAARTAAAE